MGQRAVRVNELIKREISGLLHTTYRTEAVYITVTDVEVTPDLRQARVFYSVLQNDPERLAHAKRFLEQIKTEVRRTLGQNVILKYTPHLRFVHDDSQERGARIIQLLDELDEPRDEKP